MVEEAQERGWLYRFIFCVHICGTVGFGLAIVALVSGPFWLRDEQFSRVAMGCLIYIAVYLLHRAISYSGGKE